MSTMASVTWQAYQDDSDSDGEVAIMTPHNDYESSSRLLNDDTESACIQRRTARSSSGSVRSKMLQRTKDERKYKYSLISVLLIGICLILMINIGLGVRNCEQTEQEKKSESHDSICLDKLTKQDFPWQHYRLPTDLSPDRYHIFMHPNLTTNNYTGQVKINITVNKNTKYIILHSRNHVFNSVFLKNIQTPSEEVLKNPQILHCDSNEMVSFNFDKEFEKGQKYELRIIFSGNLTYSLGGFYLSKYKREDGTEKVIGVTQFESTDARSAFPCFDEPAFKANFSLSMVREPDMFTLFNMPSNVTKDFKHGLKMDVFPSTVTMSTYLVAFIVSDFAKISKKTKNGVKVSIYSSADQINNTKFALDIAVDVLQYYDTLFKIPYPLPKLDLVAIPDFAAGAMENWGLVTYRETALLYNPSTSAVADQEWVALVIAHELSHQWFGNLVTMQWWNDLWLNEGFASYIEFHGVDNIKPSWDILSDFVVDQVLVAMSTDSSRYTHPISVRVTNSQQIKEQFDAITYNKGASLINMLTDYLGDTFFHGVDAYLKKFSYKNAVNNDLLVSISEQDSNHHPNLMNMMQSWTTLPGYPLLKVSKNGNKIVIEQSRFLYPINASDPDRSGVWHIPLTYVTDSSPTTPTRNFMSSQTDSFTLSNFKWIKFNHNLTGYYKVSYDRELWEPIVRQINANHLTFTTEDRISIVTDAFIMARVGRLNYSDLFTLLQYFKREKTYAPVVTTLVGLSYMRYMLKFSLKTKECEIFQTYVVDLLTPIYEDLGWKKRSELDRMQGKLQSTVVHEACRNKYQPCIDKAYSEFSNWKNNVTTLEAGFMTTVFDTAVLHGTPADWDYLWSYYCNTTDATLKGKILGALAQSPKVGRIAFLLDELLKGSEGDIRPQSASRLLTSMSKNVVGGMLAWKFVKEHWEKITAIHPVAEFTMRRIIAASLFTILDKEELASAEVFFACKGVADLKSIKRSLESSQINIYWTKTQLPSVTLWLNENKSSWSRKP